jgi:tartrate-resistant acid phosphatase type 5
VLPKNADGVFQQPAEHISRTMLGSSGMRRLPHRRFLLAGAAIVAASAAVFATCGQEEIDHSLHGVGSTQDRRDTWMPPPLDPVPDGGCPAPAAETDALRVRDAGTLTRFAAIGDYGYAGPTEQAVADLVKGWRPEFVVTLGDNNYPMGAAETIDFNIGLFYHDFIAPYVGRFGCGGARNRFFPALGNHDWYSSGARPYLDYFGLPGNERYYDVAWGDVHVFAIDSDPHEPDGVTAGSVQAKWLEATLAASKARWQIVYFHHAPYSSGPHGATTSMRWPFKAWGADLVLAGHDHTYERITVGGLPYIVNGLGGAVFYAIGTPVEGSAVRFNETAGALFIEADAKTLRARFQTIDGRIVDELVLGTP